MGHSRNNLSQIEEWCEKRYPSYVLLSPNGYLIDESDARKGIAKRDAELATELRRRKRAEELRTGVTADGVNGDHAVPNGETQEFSKKELAAMIGGLMAVSLILAFAIVWVIMKYFS